VEKSGGPDVLLVEGTDYELDLKWGRIFFFESAVNIAAGDQVDVTLAADAGAAASTNNVKALTQTNVAVALKFIGENPANNDKTSEVTIHQIQVKAEGDLALIGEEWMTMGFTGTAERNATADPTSPFITIKSHVNS
jgi:hypothetical protein